MDNNTKKLTVIVPVYNCEKRLKQCLDSICNQTYKNFDIVCIDDGSKDNSKKICEEYAINDKRITVLNHENHGVSFTRNRGIDYAKSEYVTFCDVDDFLELNAYEKAMSVLNETDVDLLCFSFRTIYKDHTTETKPNYPLRKVLNGDYILNEIIVPMFGFREEVNPKNLDIMFPCWNKIFKKSVIQNNDVAFNTERITGEDWQFCLDYLLNAKSIYFLNETLYNYYHCESNTLSNSQFIKNIFEITVNDRIRYMNKVPSLPWNSPNKQLTFKNKWLKLASYYYQKDKKNFKSYINKMFQTYVELKIYDYVSDNKTLYKLDSAAKNNDEKRFYNILKRYTANNLIKSKFKNIFK